MRFSIHDVANTYIYKRFPNASDLEKEKYIDDWDNKIKDSVSLVEDFKKRIGDPYGKKILDAGCGNGGISIAFAMAHADVYGVEIEEDLYRISIEHAKPFDATPHFYLYNGLQLPFESNTFDYVVSASVLEHTDNPILYLQEILRVLKPQGLLYLGFPNRFAPRETHTQLLFLTYMPSFLQHAYIKLLKRNPLKDNNLHFYSYFDLRKMIKNKYKGYGWEIVSENGSTNSLFKKIIKRLMKFIGLPYKAFLPHILVILKKVN